MVLSMEITTTLKYCTFITLLVYLSTLEATSDSCPDLIENCSKCNRSHVSCLKCDIGYFLNTPETRPTVTFNDETTDGPSDDAIDSLLESTKTADGNITTGSPVTTPVITTTTSSTTQAPLSDQCIKCSVSYTNCTECDSSKCFICQNNTFLLDQSKCVGECPPEYNTNNGICTKVGPILELWAIIVIAVVSAIVVVLLIILIVVCIRRRGTRDGSQGSKPPPPPAKDQLMNSRSHTLDRDGGVKFENAKEGSATVGQRYQETTPNNYTEKSTTSLQHAGSSNPVFENGSTQSIPQTPDTPGLSKHDYVNVKKEVDKMKKKKKSKDKAPDPATRDYQNVKNAVAELQMKKSQRGTQNASHAAEPAPRGHGANKKLHGYINDPTLPGNMGSTGVLPQESPGSRDARYNTQVPPAESDDEEEYVNHDPIRDSAKNPNSYYNLKTGDSRYYNVSR